MTATDLDPLRPFDPETIGPYHLLGRLGPGGMGEVYLGRDRRARLAAVKVVHDGYAGDPQFRARFAREVDIARSIRVAWSAAVVAADPDAATPWLATEYIAGPSLEKLVTATGPLSEPSAGALAAKLADSLVELHALNVVHRDVKPSNVLIGPDRPYLIDFGIARAADITAITRTGAVLGAPGYMSPEQALGAGICPASDVFSLAAVVVFAVTGHGPFGTTASPVAMLRRIVDEPPELDAVPDALRRVLEPCLAKDPAARPTAAGLATLLAEHRGQADHWPPTGNSRLVPDLPAGPPERVVGRRRLLGAAAFGVLVAAGIGAGVVVGAGRREPEPESPSGVLRWRFDLPPRNDGYGGPERILRVSAGAGLVIADTGSRIFGLDARSGRVRWESVISGSIYALRRTSLVGDTVYSHNSHGMFALDAATGGLRWEQDGAELLHATPTMLLGRTNTEGTVPARELFALDPATGTTRWRHPIPLGDDTVRSVDEADPKVSHTDGRLHVGIRDTLTTFDAATGAVQWETPWPGVGGGVDGHGDAVVQVQPDRVASFDAASGAHRWSHPISYDGYHQPVSTGAPVVHDGAVLVSSQSLHALDAATGRPLWTVAPEDGGNSAWIDPALIALGRTLFAVRTSSSDFRICGYDVASGDLRWALPFDGCLGGADLQLTTTDDSVYLGVNSSREPERSTVYAVGE